MNRKQILITVLAGLVVVSIAFAADKIYQNIQNYYEAPEQTAQEPEFGSMVSPDNVLNWSKHNGMMTFMLGGAWDSSTVASTTFFAVLNPFFDATNTDWTNAGNLSNLKTNIWHGTSTIDYMILDIPDTATTSYDIECGASDNPFEESTYDMINTWSYSQATDIGLGQNEITTSTKTYVDTTASTTMGSGVTGIGSGHETMINKAILSNAYPFITCVASTTGAEANTSSLYSAGSKADGTFKIRIYKMQE